MCALIAMAIYSTEENKKDEYLEKALKSLVDTVDFTKHRLILSVNGYTPKTNDLMINMGISLEIIYNNENLGTAEAINRAWQKRLPGENAIKMDDDIVIHDNDWIYLMEEAIRRDSRIGQIGLKRRDCMEAPWIADSFYKSELYMLPHKPGEKWIAIEKVNHVMGSCVMHSSALLDKVGYLYQPNLYGFDDSCMSHRSRIAGFYNAFLCAVDIEHIDPGTTPFQKWKEAKAGEYFQEYIQTIRDYTSGKRSIFYDPFKINHEQLTGVN